MMSEKSTIELGTATGGAFVVDAGLVATGRTCVIGASGSGKSYAVGVICEELCRNGVPFAVVDTEGEHSGLKEKYEAIWVAEEGNPDLTWEGLDLEDLARQAPDISPLILDVSDLREYKEKVGGFLTSLYNTLSERRTPYLVILEEADKFIPQAGERLPIFDEVARRGRKRGLGMMICSQRPSLVDKNVLSQCSNQLIGRLIIQNDLKAVAQFFPGHGYPKELTSVSAGEFYAIGGLSPKPELIKIRQRTTKHGGATPALVKRVARPYVGPSNRVRSPASIEKSAPSSGTLLGLRPAIKAEDVPAVVRREKRFGFFGTEETVADVQLRFRNLIQVGVRLRKGILKRRFETLYMILDDKSGKIVTLERGFETGTGFERLVGLSMLQVEVLKEVAPDSDTSVLDISSRVGEAKGVVSRALGVLSDKRLVRTIEIRRKKLFRRLVDLPPEPTEVIPRELEQVSDESGKVDTPRLRETQVREAVKGLWDGADVESFEGFAYPVYLVILALRRKQRQVWLDARTGKELTF